MGRPRLDSVRGEIGVCPEHGSLEFRIHKIGKNKAGEQRYRKRCPRCHTLANGGTDLDGSTDPR